MKRVEIGALIALSLCWVVLLSSLPPAHTVHVEGWVVDKDLDHLTIETGKPANVNETDCLQCHVAARITITNQLYLSHYRVGEWFDEDVPVEYVDRKES
jgi:hypothetical protein